MKLKHKFSEHIHSFLRKCGIPLCTGAYAPCWHFAQWRRQNTAYADDKYNYVFVCDECLEEINDYWKEKWDDYYRGCFLQY